MSVQSPLAGYLNRRNNTKSKTKNRNTTNTSAKSINPTELNLNDRWRSIVYHSRDRGLELDSQLQTFEGFKEWIISEIGTLDLGKSLITAPLGYDMVNKRITTDCLMILNKSLSKRVHTTINALKASMRGDFTQWTSKSDFTGKWRYSAHEGPVRVRGSGFVFDKFEDAHISAMRFRIMSVMHLVNSSDTSSNDRSKLLAYLDESYYKCVAKVAEKLLERGEVIDKDIELELYVTYEKYPLDKIKSIHHSVPRTDTPIRSKWNKGMANATDFFIHSQWAALRGKIDEYHGTTDKRLLNFRTYMKEMNKLGYKENDGCVLTSLFDRKSKLEVTFDDYVYVPLALSRHIYLHSRQLRPNANDPLPYVHPLCRGQYNTIEGVTIYNWSFGIDKNTYHGTSYTDPYEAQRCCQQIRMPLVRKYVESFNLPVDVTEKICDFLKA